MGDTEQKQQSQEPNYKSQVSVVIDGRIAKAIRHEAVEQERTQAEVVEEALRGYLATRTSGTTGGAS